MKINRKILAGTLLLLSAAIPIQTFAEEEAETRYRSLTITAVDGHQYGLNLVPNLGAHFNNEADFVLDAPEFDESGNPIVDEETGMRVYKTYLTVPGYELSSIVFSSEITGIDSPEAATDFDILYDFNASTLRVTGAEGKAVAVYAADGRQEATVALSADTTVDMSRFGSGIHIVTIDSKTFKLLVK